ncbi:PhzF family phenazine biosynthesis protein [Paenibacillus aurantiacus]|uniref:PhzF family phenazine biosynthesis protein n=1 Tax=Paenibacillus aurantiacus TaxID=1936118 RepID=A0ABV5KZ17_9BACL
MKYYVVDAFADRVFEGNPAGVIVTDAPLPDSLMQSIAGENNLSETAFAIPEGDDYRLRWFTPGGEIDLCGHATLATAFVIANFREPGAETIRFRTLSGELVVRRIGDLYELNFPSRMPAAHPFAASMADALGITPRETYLSRDLMFVLESEADVANLTPDLAKLAALPDGLGVLVTAPSAEGKPYDFVSRAFFPKLKVPEDPVCGSAHCSFVPYWSERLGKRKLTARQVSARGGTLYCEDLGERVSISGRAVLYATAELHVGVED